jgi:hypothetical protein
LHWQYGGGDEKAISNISLLSFGFSATNNAGLLFLFSTFLFLLNIGSGLDER